MSNAKRVKHVALAFPVAVPHLALIMQGVTDYARQHGGWTFSASPAASEGFPETLAMELQSLRGWRVHGAIAVITSAAQARAARALDFPVVNLAATLRSCGLPSVMVDHEAVGRMAAEHLLECGFRRLAFYGIRSAWYGELRRRGFVARCEQAGAKCFVLETKHRRRASQPWRQELERLDRWMKSLPTSVGLLAVNDYCARLVVDECHRLGLSVPDDVAVLGVDNDLTICEFCQPQLSSVSRSGWRVGYEAAAMLDRLMSGEKPPDDNLLVAPDGVVTRRSTDVMAFDDPRMNTLVQYIRDHLDEPFGVERLLRVVAMSRRWLQQRFRRHLHCTPQDYLCKMRIERAAQLLRRNEKMKIAEVAQASGFESDQHFRQVFRRLMGITPREYRRNQVGDASHPPPSNVP